MSDSVRIGLQPNDKLLETNLSNNVVKWQEQFRNLIVFQMLLAFLCNPASNSLFSDFGLIYYGHNPERNKTNATSTQTGLIPTSAVNYERQGENYSIWQVLAHKYTKL